MLPEFLRKKAADCDYMRRDCFDLDLIRRLRMMAAELRAKADEIEGTSRRALQK
jgi:hypothetical protein